MPTLARIETADSHHDTRPHGAWGPMVPTGREANSRSEQFCSDFAQHGQLRCCSPPGLFQPAQLRSRLGTLGHVEQATARGRLPMTSVATPVSAAAKQQHQDNDNKDQFHEKSPSTVTTSNSELPAVN